MTTPLNSEYGAYVQIAGFGISAGWDTVDGVTFTGFTQGSLVIAGAAAQAININFDLNNPVTIENVTLYLGAATPTGTPVMSASALINLMNGAQYFAIGLGVTDVIEIGIYWEGPASFNGEPALTIMGDPTGFSIHDIQCFPASTQVQIDETTCVAISDICVGDTVLAFDASVDSGRGDLLPRKVTRLYRSSTDEWIKLSWLEDGHTREIFTTPGHLFLNKSGQFKKIKDLIFDGKACIVSSSGTIVEAVAEEIRYSSKTAHLFEQSTMYGVASEGDTFPREPKSGWQTYNIEVEDLHTYVAGGVRVHNESWADALARTGRFDLQALAQAALNQGYTGGLHPNGGPVVSVGAAAWGAGGDSNGDGLADNIPLRNVWGALMDYLGWDGTPMGWDGPNGNLGGNGSDGASGLGSNLPVDLPDGTIGPDTVNPATGLPALYPVVIDLDGDGVEINFQGVAFDFDTDGYLESGAWADADDGFLVIDRDSESGALTADNDITRGDELALSMLTPDNPNDTDLEALAASTVMNTDRRTIAFRGSDGVTRNIQVFNANDDGWDYVRVWRDLDQDGVVDGGLNTTNNASGELFTLDALGITQINLGYDDGSAFTTHNDDLTVGLATLNGLASFVRNGETIEGGVGDVALGHSELGYRRVAVAGVAGGYELQFEDGRRWRYLEIADQTSANADLEALVMDGAQGDGRNNILDAGGHARSVQVMGGGGADTITGGGAADMLAGGAGADALYGGGGDDLIAIDVDDLGTTGAVSGGNGIDTLMVEDDRGVTLVLDERTAEIAIGGGGNDAIRAAGDEAVYENIQMSGRDGHDSLTGSGGDDILSGDAGNDRVFGGSGDDFLSGGLGHDSLSGSTGDDQLYGGDGADTLSGGNDDDVLDGGTWQDVLTGGSGDDLMYGRNGNDQLYAGTGDDTLEGGAHNDTLSFWRGDAMLSGNSGNDTFRFEKLAEHGTQIHFGWSVLFGGTGSDTLVLEGDSTDWQLKKIGGNQWQLHCRTTPTSAERSIIDVVDIERIQFTGTGDDLVLGSFSTASTEDNYRRVGWTSEGTGDDRRFDSDFFVNGALNGWMGDDSLEISYNRDHTGDNWTILAGSGSDTVSASNAEDNIQGSSGQDSLVGGIGNDTVDGGSGSDQVVGGTGNDSVVAGSGSDVVWGDAGNDSSYGGSGSDVMLGGDGSDLLFGGTGADQLSGGLGSDTLYGDTGYDKLYGDEGNDKLIGGAGSDYLYGGDGNDTLSGDPLTNDTLAGNDTPGGGHNYLAGGKGDDALYGGVFDDQLAGEDGNDRLYGGAGRDVLMGGEGDDRLDGGSGLLDLVSYEHAETRVTVDLNAQTATGAAAGNDTLSGFEQVLGGSGSDTLYGSDPLDAEGNTQYSDNLLLGAAGNDLLDGRGGDDDLYGGDGNDTVRGNSGVDRVYGDDGNDALAGADGEDTVDGGSGHDTLGGGNDNDLLIGGSGNDNLSGDADNDTLEGGSGADVVAGDEGDDDLYGNSGNDSLYGGSGNDYLRDEGGNTAFFGGSGVDTVSYIGLGQGITVNLLEGESTIRQDGESILYDTFASVENIYGSDSGNDVLTGHAGSNKIHGNGGNDRLYGGEGNDTDTLIGGAGRDLLYGSTDDGQDIFIFGAVSQTTAGVDTRDRVYNFVSGQDDLHLSLIDADTSTAGNQAFTFNNRTAKDNAVWFVVATDYLVVRGDVDGDAVADFEIQLNGISSLVVADFVL